MRLIKGIFVISGFVTYLLSCCLTAINESKWYVPMLIGLAGMMLSGIAVLIDYLQQRTLKTDKPVVKIQDRDYAGEFEKLHNKIILDEIMKG